MGVKKYVGNVETNVKNVKMINNATVVKKATNSMTVIVSKYVQKDNIQTKRINASNVPTPKNVENVTRQNHVMIAKKVIICTKASV